MVKKVSGKEISATPKAVSSVAIDKEIMAIIIVTPVLLKQVENLSILQI